jgi:hypothetical protein
MPTIFRYQDFLPKNGNVRRCFDSHAYYLSLNGDYGYGDIQAGNNNPLKGPAG